MLWHTYRVLSRKNAPAQRPHGPSLSRLGRHLRYDTLTTMQLQPTQSEILLTEDPRRLPSFADVFHGERPVEIEIGCGKGKFLIARALEEIDINFLGIDVVWKWMKFGVARSKKRELSNIRFIKADARELIRFGLASESVSVFHIYFPDPWPKRRHRKRRLITGEFMALLHSRLVPNGLIELATDYEDYYLQMKRAVVQSGVNWSRVDESANHRLFDGMRKTNYELKYESAGRTLHYVELEKQNGESP